MDVWYVGRAPVGHVSKENAVIFFHKAHIFAGQVKPSADINDWAWVKKDEVLDYVKDYTEIKDLLSY